MIIVTSVITIIIITIFEKFLVRAGWGGDIGMRAEPRLPTDKMHTFLTVCAINWWTLYLGLSTVHQGKGWRHWAWTVSGHKSSPNRWVVAYHLTFRKMKITILLKNEILLSFSTRRCSSSHNSLRGITHPVHPSHHPLQHFAQKPISPFQ